MRILLILLIILRAIAAIIWVVAFAICLLGCLGLTMEFIKKCMIEGKSTDITAIVVPALFIFVIGIWVMVDK